MRREVEPEAGWIPKAGTALGAVIGKMAGRFHGVKPGRHSCPPSAQDSKSMGESSAELSLTFSSPV